MNQGLVSIIVPVYKAEKYIHQCIDSLLAQTYRNIEVILVDDGSPDHCGKICDEYAAKDSRVKVIHQQNGGVSVARQTGIDHATGEYSIHADPDDWVELNMIEELVAKAVSDNADMGDSFINYVPYATKRKLLSLNNPMKSINYLQTIPKEKIVLWVGRLGYDTKRLDYMLKIWMEINKSHPDWKLKILGSGDWNYWKRIIAQYHIKNADVVGFCNPTEYYAKASILCMTSVAEGWGMVLVEAQQYGCVPMAYRSYAALDDIIVDGENGYSVKAFDQNDYVNKLRRLMDDVDLRRRMAMRGIESVKRFDVDKIAATWIAHFESIL